MHLTFSVYRCTSGFSAKLSATTEELQLLEATEMFDCDMDGRPLRQLRHSDGAPYLVATGTDPWPMQCQLRDRLAVIERAAYRKVAAAKRQPLRRSCQSNAAGRNTWQPVARLAG